MKVNDNEIRKTLIKEYIKRNWQNFIMVIFIITFLTTVILYMSTASMQTFYYGKVTSLTTNGENELFLEVILDSGKNAKVPIQSKVDYKKGKRVKLKFIQNEMLQVKDYRLEEYIEK